MNVKLIFKLICGSTLALQTVVCHRQLFILVNMKLSMYGLALLTSNIYQLPPMVGISLTTLFVLQIYIPEIALF